MQTLLSRTATIIDAQRAAVAELMAPTENPIGNPSVILPTMYGPAAVLLAPAEPDDGSEDD